VLPPLPPTYIGEALPETYVCTCGKKSETERGLQIHIGRAKTGMHTRIKQYVDPRFMWSPHTLEMWEGFRHDFATQEYGPGEIAMAKQLARLIEEANRAAGKSAAMWSIVTQWMDRLMLTPKGKRDARLMLGEPAQVTKLRSLPAQNFKRTATG
jgi:hypothetical protein